MERGCAGTIARWARLAVLAWAACAAFGALGGEARAEEGLAERRLLAVLELAHAGALADDVLRVSADMVRGAALKQLPRSGWQVMTRENILAMLPPGTDLAACVGECEVETGRRLGAWLVVTGEVAQIGGSLMVALKAHRTDRGELVAQSVATSASAEGVLEAARQAATDLFAQVAPAEVPAAPRAPVVSAPMLGADADIGALAAQAERLEAERKAAAEAARRAEEAAKALAAAKAAEARRLVAEAQAALRPQVERDFGAIRRLVETPSDEGRPALDAFVKKYGAASVLIDGVSHRLEVPEVAQVERALGGPAGMEWVRIEGGRFQMGSSNGEGDERPMQQVWVSAFHLARTEVTVRQYRACVERGPCTEPNTGGACNWGVDGRGDHPINCVDWEQAGTFARWAKARLPSEAEWEFAARGGGRDQTYPWGTGNATSSHAVMAGSGGTAPVCGKPGGNSVQGVCDLAGNVWEWLNDWYGSYGEAQPDTQARLGGTGYRVLRGGSWTSTNTLLRAANRAGLPPNSRLDNLGFRIAR